METDLQAFAQVNGGVQVRANKIRSKVRVHVGHAFGFQKRSMGGKFIRTFGQTRAKAKIGMMKVIQLETGAAAPR